MNKTSNEYKDFRESIYKRLSAPEVAISIIEQLEKSFFTGIKVYGITDWEEDAPKDDDFLSILALEYHTKIKNWHTQYLSLIHI